MPQKFTSIIPSKPSRGGDKITPIGTQQINSAPLNLDRPTPPPQSSPITKTSSDPLNQSVFADDGYINVNDAINFKIRDVVNNRVLQFRCTVSNLIESSQPTWNQIDYVGRPYPIHIYKGVSRTLTFDFKIYANNEREMPIIWDRINYLSGLTHPSNYSSGGYMVPPYIEITIGDLYKNQFGFISGFNMSIPQESAWETRSGKTKLPHMVDINLSINIIEDGLKSPLKKLYGFEPKYALEQQDKQSRG